MKVRAALTAVALFVTGVAGYSGCKCAKEWLFWDEELQAYYGPFNGCQNPNNFFYPWCFVDPSTCTIGDPCNGATPGAFWDACDATALPHSALDLGKVLNITWAPATSLGCAASNDPHFAEPPEGGPLALLLKLAKSGKEPSNDAPGGASSNQALTYAVATTAITRSGRKLV
jgi:hypothetical protein